MTTLYLSGPLSGWEDNNYPLFHEVAAILREAGYAVVNPAEGPDDAPADATWQWWMRRAIAAMMTADAVAGLPDWTTSQGARTEIDLALNLGMTVRAARDWIAESDDPEALRRYDVAISRAVLREACE